MVGFLWNAIKVAVNAIATFFSGIVGEWMRIQNARYRGNGEPKNEAHEENAKRRKKADKVLQQPVKKGEELIDAIRERNKSAGN